MIFIKQRIFEYPLVILMRSTRLFIFWPLFADSSIVRFCTKIFLLYGCHLKMWLFISKRLKFVFCRSRNFFESLFFLISSINSLFFNEVQDDRILLTKRELLIVIFCHDVAFFVSKVDSILSSYSIERF